MRLPALVALIWALALPALAESHWPGPGDSVTPSAAGLEHTGAEGSTRTTIAFGTGFQDTMHLLVAVFGPDVEVGFPQECGAGPLVSAQIPGQIGLMFQNDRFAGWMLIGDDALRMDGGIGVGSPRDALEALGSVETVETGLGTEFEAGEVFGLLSEDGNSVQAIWTGTTCIFR